MGQLSTSLYGTHHSGASSIKILDNRRCISIECQRESALIKKRVWPMPIWVKINPIARPHVSGLYIPGLTQAIYEHAKLRQHELCNTRLENSSKSSYISSMWRIRDACSSVWGKLCVTVAKCLAMTIRARPRRVAVPRAFKALPVSAPGPGTVLVDEPEVVPHSVDRREETRETPSEDCDTERLKAMVRVTGAIRLRRRAYLCK